MWQFIKQMSCRSKIILGISLFIQIPLITITIVLNSHQAYFKIIGQENNEVVEAVLYVLSGLSGIISLATVIYEVRTLVTRIQRHSPEPEQCDGINMEPIEDLHPAPSPKSSGKHWTLWRSPLSNQLSSDSLQDLDEKMNNLHL